MATDQVQIVREAIVEILDTRAEVVAVTGRNSDNIVAWANVGEATEEDRSAGIIIYQMIVSTEPAVDQSAIDILVQFAAIAAEESTANELIGVVRRVLDAPAFLALTPPIDARVTSRARRSAPFDPDESLARADTDITLRVHFPA